MMHALKAAILVTGVVVFAGALLPAQALAQNTPAQPAVQAASIMPIGKVVTAAGSVSIEHVSAVVVQASLGGQSSGAKVGDSVYLGDVVSTGSDGRVGITFTDGTAFDLSPNARMVMNEFIYDPNSKSNSSLLSLTKGTFTFVAGKIAKSGDMKVNTPVATMGIRGTTPRVEIAEDGSVKFSTLIEESKGQNNRAAAPGAAPAVEEKDKPNLQICRGC